MTYSKITDNKIMSWEELCKKATVWKFKEQKIVFTNGCFDILHIGHIYSLQSAADFGNKLVVGLNSDASVKRLKGESRPINPENFRAKMLASLSCVAGVVIFEEDTPFNLISHLMPDVLVKGGDYKKSEIVGADIVEKNGGKVEIIQFKDDISTTQIIKRLS